AHTLAAHPPGLATRHTLGPPGDRRHERLVPKNPRATMVMADGTTALCRIIDMSLSGAAVTSEVKPPVGSVIWLGKTQARIVRVNDEGFAVEFTRLQHPDF